MELKFRAKANLNDEWIYASNIHKVILDDTNEELWVIHPKNEKIEHLGDGYIKYRPLVVDEETIGQYTGINDENDVEIYEGDIVKYIYDELPMGHYREVEVTGVITWGVLGYGLRIIGSHKPDIVFSDLNFDIEDYHFEENAYYPLHEMQILSEDLEVIGNIYQTEKMKELGWLDDL